ESAVVNGYRFDYVRPTAQIEEAGGKLERIDLGSVVRVSRNGKEVAILEPSRGYYPNMAPMAGAVSRFFEGESTSEIALKAGFLRDVWVAETPDISLLTPVIEKGDAVFQRADRAGLSGEARSIFLAEALTGLTARYRDAPPPATFRLIVSPMVFWVRVGSIIVFAGGLIAAWPSLGAVRDLVRARYAARVAQDLERA
ncbi:MAG: heme lyase CcmF/NrfE family subunit, partial [Solirubrobacterales bacterium]